MKRNRELQAHTLMAIARPKVCGRTAGRQVRVLPDG